MDRLTKWIDERWAENHDNDTLKWKNGNRACMTKLAQYENTGLTPAEVAELAQAKEEFSHLQQENERLKCELSSVNTIFSEVNKQNEQLKEWLRLAVNSLTDELTCISCAYHDSDECDLEENCNYKWQHSDKLKGLIEI